MATATPLGNIKALAFDAYGTLFDVFSVTALCEQLFPGNGTALAQLWRAKQLQYSLLRSLMGRYKDFWQLTEDGLLYAAKSLKLDLTASKQRQLDGCLLEPHGVSRRQPWVGGAEDSWGCVWPSSRTVNQRCSMPQRETRESAPLLDATMSADELKIFKPSPRVYRLARTRLKVAAGALGFVSSNSWDVSGAASAGAHDVLASVP